MTRATLTVGILVALIAMPATAQTVLPGPANGVVGVVLEGDCRLLLTRRGMLSLDTGAWQPFDAELRRYAHAKGHVDVELGAAARRWVCAAGRWADAPIAGLGPGDWSAQHRCTATAGSLRCDVDFTGPGAPSSHVVVTPLPGHCRPTGPSARGEYAPDRRHFLFVGSVRDRKCGAQHCAAAVYRTTAERVTPVWRARDCAWRTGAVWLGPDGLVDRDRVVQLGATPRRQDVAEVGAVDMWLEAARDPEGEVADVVLVAHRASIGEVRFAIGGSGRWAAWTEDGRRFGPWPLVRPKTRPGGALSTLTRRLWAAP